MSIFGTRAPRRLLSGIVAAAFFFALLSPAAALSTEEPPQTEAVQQAPPEQSEESSAATETTESTQAAESTEGTQSTQSTAVPETTTATEAAVAAADLPMLLTLEAAEVETEAPVFRRIDTLEQLVTGQYMLVSTTGTALGSLDVAFITAAQATLEGDTAAGGGVWDVTVDGGVILTDENGLSIAPLESSINNGLQQGRYAWQVSCIDGLFSFHGSNGTEAVTLAGNQTLGTFRAYRDTAVSASPEAYPSAFALYRREEEQEPEELERSTVAQVQAMAGQTAALEGVIVCAREGVLALQDETGGIGLTFSAPVSLSVGDALRVVGCYDGSFAVSMYEILGSAECPSLEATVEAALSGALEYTRICLRGVTLGADRLTQGDASILLSGDLPEGYTSGAQGDVYGVVFQGQLLADTVLLEAAADSGPGWYSVALEDILETDTIALTAESGGSVWALSSAAGSSPAAVEVTVTEGVMTGSGEIGWQLLRREEGLVLRASEVEAYLSSYSQSSTKLYINSSTSKYPNIYWTLDSGTLKNVNTGRYLKMVSGNWVCQNVATQSLQFWLLERAPAVTATAAGALAAGSAVTLSCALPGAAIYYALSADGESYGDFALYTGAICPETDFGTLYVKAYALAEGYSAGLETVWAYTEETPAPTEPDPTDPEPTEPQEEAPADLGWNLYFGLLHAHTDLSDGLGSVEQAFSEAAAVEGLDFFAVTDHSNSFDNADAGAIGLDGSAISTEWARGQAAAAAVTDGSFVGLFGYEMTWQEGKHLGHISTFATPGWQTRDQEGFSTLEAYYQALTTVPGSVSQFNHPGAAYGDFESFSHYSAAYDAQITLLEVGGEGSFTAYSAYTQALDQGWHVAPTNSQNNHSGSFGTADDGRTVILAQELTQEGLYQAMRARRVYATEDRDLRICYWLNGSIMGSILGLADTAQIEVFLEDPTDAAIGTVEVLVDGGVCLASAQVDSARETVYFSLPGGYSYYYLRVTQPDGDIAVTAPVWMDGYTDMGISSFTADSDLPIQGQAITLTLELYNEETAELVLDTLSFYAGDTCIHTVSDPGALERYSFSCTYSGLGVTVFRAVVTGTVNGEARRYERELTLRYHAPEQISQIWVDGTHGSAGIDQLSCFTALAAQADRTVTVFTQGFPESGELLVILPPEGAFEEEFVENVVAFARAGGSLILCGQAELTEEAAQALNGLLEALGSTMSLNVDIAVDDVNNGGASDELYTTVFNTDSPWCAALSDGQFYSQQTGCTVNPGSGTWLVRGLSTAYTRSSAQTTGACVLLAAEDTAWGGVILAAGSPFLTDEQMPESTQPLANQTILETLLTGAQDDTAGQTGMTLSDISAVRAGEAGTVYCVRGYVTAGTSNPYNSFPQTLYLQDGTGGIAVMPFTDSGIAVGTAIEVTGYLDTSDGNPVLRLIDYSLPQADAYRYTARALYNSAAMNTQLHGGQLLQVEGEVVERTLTADGKGVSRIVLRDIRGDLATVQIEDCIFSGSTGVNDLASTVEVGLTVRAIGILHLDSSGTPVLRVRNCEEVVYVPPVADPSNPKTGDARVFWTVQK